MSKRENGVIKRNVTSSYFGADWGRYIYPIHPFRIRKISSTGRTYVT